MKMVFISLILLLLAATSDAGLCTGRVDISLIPKKVYIEGDILEIIPQPNRGPFVKVQLDTGMKTGKEYYTQNKTIINCFKLFQASEERVYMWSVLVDTGKYIIVGVGNLPSEKALLL